MTNIKKIFTVLMMSLFIIGCDNAEQEVNISNDTGHLKMLRIGGLELSPAFEITHKHYVSTAAFSVTKINLQALTKSWDDRVSVNGKKLEKQKDFSLAIGNNQFTIIVTNNEGLKEEYQLTVTRLEQNNLYNNSLDNGE